MGGGKGADIQGGMSKDERQALLDYENELAKSREKEAREALMKQERMRVAQERSQRSMLQQAEKERVETLEQMEVAASGAVQDPAEEMMKDRDRRATQMWAALGSQVNAANTQAANITTKRPE